MRCLGQRLLVGGAEADDLETEALVEPVGTVRVFHMDAQGRLFHPSLCQFPQAGTDERRGNALSAPIPGRRDELGPSALATVLAVLRLVDECSHLSRHPVAVPGHLPERFVPVRKLEEGVPVVLRWFGKPPVIAKGFDVRLVDGSELILGDRADLQAGRAAALSGPIMELVGAVAGASLFYVAGANIAAGRLACAAPISDLAGRIRNRE